MLTALHRRLDAARAHRAEDAADAGFTLIELLVVVVIIGILVAIAIPVYSNYRKGAENKSAAADVRNAIPVIEQYYTDKPNGYPASMAAVVTYVAGNATAINFDATPPAAAVQGTTTPHQANISPGNSFLYSYNATANTYIVCGLNSDGGTLYEYKSSTGQTTSSNSQSSITNTNCS